MKHDLALFDFDGTLADSLPWVGQAVQRLAAELQFKPIPAEKLKTLRHCEVSSLLKTFDFPRWKMPRMLIAMRRLMATEVEQIPLFDGIEHFCRRAHARGLGLGVVSSNSEANVRTILGPATAALFTCYECGVSLLGKASKIRRAARATSTPVNRAIYIGDELRDFDAAKAAGMPFGAVSWGWADASAWASRQP